MSDDRRRRRPLPGEGSDRFGTNFDTAQTGGVPEEQIELSVNAGILAPYADDLRRMAVEYRLNLERGHLQARRYISAFLGLQHLRGFWPMTSSNEGNDVYDVSGAGRTLTGNGNIAFGLSSGLLAPVASFGVVNLNKYFSRANENGINWTGLDNFFMMAWIYPQGVSTTGVAPVMSKGDESTGVEYYVTFDRATWRLKVAAGDQDYEAPASRAISLDTWHFIGAGIDVGADQFIVYIDGWHNTVQANSPTLSATTDPFYLARHDNGATVRRWLGELGPVVLLNDVPTEEQLDNVFDGTRLLFGR